MELKMKPTNSAIVLVRSEGRALLLQRRLDDRAHPGGVWCLPGGKREGDEPILQTAMRELEEETGLTPALTLFVSSSRDPKPWIESYWARIPEPHRPYKNMEHDMGPGRYWAIIRDRLVEGPIIFIHSDHDAVLKRWYALATDNRGELEKRCRPAPPYGDGPNLRTAEFPTFGAVGSYGAQGPIPCRFNIEMQPLGGTYDFQKGCVYNVDASDYVRNHMDVVKAEIAQVFFQVELAK